jgi:hypothetical protein
MLENESAKVWLDGNIMHCYFKKDKLDIDVAKECVTLRLAASGERYFPTLIDATTLKSVTKEARDYFGSDEGSRQILASALIINSVVGKFITNFFLQINKPKVPIRVFTDKKDAVSWLRQFEKVPA